MVAVSFWLAAWVGSGAWVVRQARGLFARTARWRALRHDEQGTAAIEFTMALPLYMLLIAIFIESSLVILAKCGTSYAAFAAARSAGAWNAATPLLAHRAAERAAVLALVPFSSADSAHHAGPSSAAAQQSASDLAAAWPYPPRYIAARTDYARSATSVATHRAGRGTHAAVTFRYPVRIALLGRAIGHRASWAPNPWVYEIHAEATVPTALPEHGLGINYVPRF